MKMLFSLGFFIGSLAFTLYGLSSLDLSDSFGRPGPGYFPLIIGVMLIGTTGFSSYQEFRKRQHHLSQSMGHIFQIPAGEHETTHAQDTLVVVALIVLFLFTLKPLGSVLSMVLFTGAFLAYFNKGRHKLNITYSIVLPLGVFLLFDVLLQAGLPKGIFD